ncbi:MAG: IS1634 family transposase [Desulfohalobiaceae bacterium]|nr:IS1634 family transposase [Desulfohalobiaceae bacterium]
MPHLYKKSKQGRTYWYLRETYRDQGKVKVKWQKYLGTADTILAKFQEKEAAKKPVKVHTEAFGAVFLAHVLEIELDTISLIDSIVPRRANEKGPTVGEYFFYAWANRMIAPKSKRALKDWYKKTAIQHIRPVDLNQLTSERYWEKWSRVSREQLEEIGARFFAQIWSKQQMGPETLLFDTTNYFTYMATKTDSELAKRGKNKSSKHHLRQVGVGVLQDRISSLPLYYTTYSGNLHDSKLFHQVLDEIFGVLAGFTRDDKQLTVIFDKGMNSPENIAFIDERQHIHFVTTYSPYHVEYEAKRDPETFTILDIPKNQELKAKGQDEDCLRAYRTTHHLWGRERTLVVTFNPATKRKKEYDLAKKLDRVRAELLEFRRKYNNNEPQWRDETAVSRRYRRLCEDLYISPKYYDLTFTSHQMSFRRNSQEIKSAKATMGKNVIITDNSRWSTEQIVLSLLDRHKIERQFRVSKDPFQVRVNPMFHWTDHKILCHLLICMIALTALRLLELKLDDKYTSKVIMEEMHSFDCVLTWPEVAKKPELMLEEPTDLQAEILRGVGYVVQDAWVLQA